MLKKNKGTGQFSRFFATCSKTKVRNNIQKETTEQGILRKRGHRSTPKFQTAPTTYFDLHPPPPSNSLPQRPDGSKATERRARALSVTYRLLRTACCPPLSTYCLLLTPYSLLLTPYPLLMAPMIPPGHSSDQNRPILHYFS